MGVRKIPGRRSTSTDLFLASFDRVSKKVNASPDAPLKDYLKLCPQYFPVKSLYNIPLGASIKEIDDRTFDLVVPKLQFFDIWLLAKATTSHRHVPSDKLFLVTSKQ